jgi:hypothetical protein
MIKVPAFPYPMRKLRRLGSVLYTIVKTREGRFRENPFCVADLVVTPETKSLEIFFSYIFAESGYQTTKKFRVINTP